MKNSLILFLLLATGCANIIPQYTAEELSSGDLARLDSKKLKFLSPDFKAWIDAVYDENGNQIVKRVAYGDYIDELYLKEGKYILVFCCDNGYVYAFPRLAVEVQASSEYIYRCEIAETSKNFLGMKNIDSVSAHIEKQESVETDDR